VIFGRSLSEGTHKDSCFEKFKKIGLPADIRNGRKARDAFRMQHAIGGAVVVFPKKIAELFFVWIWSVGELVGRASVFGPFEAKTSFDGFGCACRVVQGVGRGKVRTGAPWGEPGEAGERKPRFDERIAGPGRSAISAGKGQELFLTLVIEHTLSKQRILEIYLNSVEWGEGVFGVEAAAQHYFRHPAQQLNPWECARLAVMLPRPKYYEKFPNSPYLAGRAQTILARMPQVELP
jgi:hypothetical protein